MDASEKIALEHLLGLGLSSVEYEPNGKNPPDFLINGRIAVEVRRLNQNVITESGGVQGVENEQHALVRIMKEIFASLGPPTSGGSWFVTYDFSRPLGSLSKLKKAIRKALTLFRDGAVEDTRIVLNDNFELLLLPASGAHATYFVLGGYTDGNTGGFVAAELLKNIQLCLREKSQKIARWRAKYPEWWLVLIDHVGYGAREELNLNHDWNKVILVNPLDPRLGYQI